jgi:hypothetical protein
MIPRLLFAPLPILFLLAADAAWAVDCETDESTARFDVNNDGTVTEIQTGLTWMRCSIGQTWDGKTCKGKPKALNWEEAINYVADLNKNGGYASHSDWRLPKLNELATISELRCGPPRINLVIFPHTRAEVYWTDNTTRGNEQHAYTFSFGNEGVATGTKAATHFVRLVRGRD